MNKILSNSMIAMLLAGTFGLVACASDPGPSSSSSSSGSGSSSSGSGSSSSGSGSSSSGSSSSGSGSSSSGSSSSGSSSSGSSSSGSSSSGSSSSSSGVAPSGQTVTFSSGQAQGAMTGWGWIALGSADKASDPTCDKGTEITNAAPCNTQTTWSKPDSLCISGSIPALPASPVQSDYDSNWGLQIGVNATSDEPTGAVGQSFSSITFTFAGAPSAGVRAVLHRKGDPAGTVYGFEGAKSGVAIDATKFNTTPWAASTGVSLTASDTSQIDKVGLQVSSSASEITVSNLCLSKIEFK